ncbi:EmrB/QacA subfamily drug resistance transporter [Microbacteriaceae bacterium SG_E_30_P1]|uniref:EmrB/QacA subfamily drug resistance transporter n=1 Tax=Antiquaquibacter oligotrophicus TaxID=2880260 RepID=A0ABT6KK43_9MICO|nr:MFS transporter [Antiquaquibacter oligotrophicus]MDH6180071.1 EmrB/QacA subfamily drug resistance transporter [Antiquaquibacter oligotrophicus]UDF14178.1 MFS transporter [Antiquaquibacter oligotrophicus]
MTTTTTVSPTATSATTRPWRTFLVLALCVGGFATLQNLVVPVLPIIQTDLGTDTAGVTWTVTAWLIAAAVATPLLGRVGDMVGRRRVLLISLGGVMVGSVLAAIAPNLEVLIAARIIQGMGGAMFPLAFGLLRDAFPRERVPSAIGAMSALIAIGGGIGAVLAGPLSEAIGWRGLFLVLLVLSIPGAILARTLVPESPERSPGRLNIPAALLLSGWLVALLLPLSDGNAWGWNSPLVIGLFALAAILLVAWIMVEWRSKEPLVDMRTMISPAIWPMNVAAVLVGAVMFSVFAYFPRFVQVPTGTGYGLGATVAESGLLTLPMLATMAVAGFLSGPLGRIIGFRAQIAGASGLIVASTIALAFVHATTWEVALWGALFGFGLGLVYSAITSVVVQSVKPTETGVASGMNANLRTIGSSLGVTIMTAIVAGSATGMDFPTEQAYETGFLTVALIGSGAILVTIVGSILAARRVVDDTAAIEVPVRA